MKAQQTKRRKRLRGHFLRPNLATKTHFRCSFNDPTDLDILFYSVPDEEFGRDSNSVYKCWVRKLYRLGFISMMPNEWTAPEDV